MNFILISAILASNFNGLLANSDTDYNQVNSDGSYAFGLSNSDIGGHYHTASGNPSTSISGRYGSRNPETGQIDETVYTAGPRGFRARGSNVHRNQDLSQVPRAPVGSADDPLADPYDDPSYNYDYKTPTVQKSENSDSDGTVNGQYSYTDDVGETHAVQYHASKDSGFEVTNGVPDAPSNVGFAYPLYKTDKNARGKISFERGPNGQYKFISAGPDQRRTETTGSDGITRGSYSYLDDKGVQRTVEYIAGPGIGYRIVSSTVGAGTHLLPPTAIPAFPSPPTLIPSPTPFAPPTVVSISTSNVIHHPPTTATTYPDFSSPDFLPPTSPGNLDYTDIEGLKPPSAVFGPYDGSYQTFQTLGAYPSPPTTIQTHISTFPPHFVPSWNGKFKGRVINIDIQHSTRAPSPGEALRRETHGDLTKCERGHNNEFTCTFHKIHQKKDTENEEKSLQSLNPPHFRKRHIHTKNNRKTK
uniref:CSON014433 protein n=1 Tax=Culicoides sonorensis TaxID=179676 RepID=A0A336LI73_CULSO